MLVFFYKNKKIKTCVFRIEKKSIFYLSVSHKEMF